MSAMDEKPPPGAGQSDRTVMLTSDGVDALAPTEPSPEATAPTLSGSGDATLPPRAARGAGTGQMKPLEVPPTPSEPRQRSGMRAALPDPAPTAPARKATGVRAALPEPSPFEPPAPRKATGVRKALTVEPEPDAAMLSQETMIRMPAPVDPSGPAPRKATGVRKALTVEPEPDAAMLSQETMIRMPAPADPSGPAPRKATGVRKALTVEPEPDAAMLSQETMIRMPAPADQSGPAPRKGTGVRKALTVEPELVDATVSIAPGREDSVAFENTAGGPAGPVTVNGMVEQRHRGFQLLLLATGVLAGGVLLVKLTIGQARPSDMNLRLLYPYGSSGGKTVNGRTAPPAEDLVFTLERSADCGGTSCLLFLAQDPATGFSMELPVAQSGDLWQLMPPPAVSKTP
jgi:hypothetical protein